MTDANRLCNFLRMCKNILPKDLTLYDLIVKKLYLGVYTVRGREGIRFALTRYLPYMRCSSRNFAHWWNDNRQTAETAFVEHVVTVALEAIEREYCHWDIRPANLLFDEDERRFYILDWDSVWTIQELRDRHSVAARAVTMESLPDSETDFCYHVLKAELTLCEQLIVKCVFIWDNISRVTKNAAALAQQFLFFQRTLPSKVLNAESGEHDIRRDHFVDLMKLFLRLV